MLLIFRSKGFKIDRATTHTFVFVVKKINYPYITVSSIFRVVTLKMLVKKIIIILRKHFNPKY